MQASNNFKRAFLEQMLLGLQLGGVSSTNMSFLEKKRVIKLSADVAMASARGGTSWWSRALIRKLAEEEKNKGLVRSIMGMEYEKRYYHSSSCNKISKSRNILRRSFIRVHGRRRMGALPLHAPHGGSAICLAKTMVRKRTRVLKSLVPGGQSLDELSLLGETLDYILSLRAQVDLLQRLTKSMELLTHRSSHQVCIPQERKDSSCV